MPNLSRNQGRTILVELSPEVDQALSDVVGFRQRHDPTRRVTQSDTIRSLVWEARHQLDAELGPVVVSTKPRATTKSESKRKGGR